MQRIKLGNARSPLALGGGGGGGVLRVCWHPPLCGGVVGRGFLPASKQMYAAVPKVKSRE